MHENSPLLHKSNSKEPQHYGEYLEPRRWWILIAFTLYSAVTNIVIACFNATGGPSMEYLNIGESELLFFIEISLAIAIIFSHVGAWHAHKNFKETLLICMFIAALGSWVRVLAGTNYSGVVFSQLLVSVGGAPIYGFATLIPERWFSVGERFFAMNVSVFSSNIGWFISIIIPPLAVGDDASRLPAYILFQAIFISIPFIMGLFVITERPKMPPSLTAGVRLIDPNSFWEEMKVLFNRPKFLPFISAFGLILALTIATMQVSAIVTRKLAFSNFNQSMLGICFVGIGIVAGFSATLWLSRQKSLRYDPIVKVLVTISFIMLIVTDVLLNAFEHPSVGLVIICHALIGIGVIGSMPFLYDSFTESTFPVQESISGNALFVMQCLLTMIINRLSLLPIVETRGFILLACILLPCWIYIVFFFKTDKEREKVDSLTELDQNSIKSIAVLEQNEKISKEEYQNIMASITHIE